MNRELKKYLFDIRTSIDSIDEYLGENRNFFKFEESKILRRAVERELEIIGEAMNMILKIDSTLNFENARQIVDTRNFVIHNYDRVDNVIIWGIISKHLPKLRIEVEQYLML